MTMSAEKNKKVGVVRFLGTNCDRDVWQAVKLVGLNPEWLWYQDRFNPDDYLALIIPGGFSYGDYLRCGALAAKAPVMESVREGAKKGWPVLGICNGFQILCESGLLPGVLIRNENCRFVDRWVDIFLIESRSKFTASSALNKKYRLPVSHGEGRYHIDENGLKRLEDHRQIWWKYVSNPNGSILDIAGVLNEDGNVGGLMPHPERAVLDWMGGTDGCGFFTHLL